MRGGEKVLLELLRLFPGADLASLLHVRGSVAAEIEARSIRTSFVQRLPFAARLYRHYLPLLPLAASRIATAGYDLVVSSSHCVAKGVRPAPGALHVCYCHTPMRYVWDRFDDYFGRLAWPLRQAVGLAAAGLRAWDVASAARVASFAANSAHVAARIARFYGRAATVVPPPVDAAFFTPGEGPPGDHDLLVTALVPYKRVELALEAYRGTGRRLLVVGSGPDADRLRQLAPDEATFLGWVDDERLRELYRGCRAALMVGVEDFGIVPLEAMACGRPAIVFGEGGGSESVVDGVTGLVFHEPTPAALRAAVDALPGLGCNTATLRARAESFSQDAFARRFRAFLEEALEAHSPARRPAW